MAPRAVISAATAGAAALAFAAGAAAQTRVYPLNVATTTPPNVPTLTVRRGDDVVLPLRFELGPKDDNCKIGIHLYDAAKGLPAGPPTSSVENHFRYLKTHERRGFFEVDYVVNISPGPALVAKIEALGAADYFFDARDAAGIPEGSYWIVVLLHRAGDFANAHQPKLVDNDLQYALRMTDVRGAAEDAKDGAKDGASFSVEKGAGSQGYTVGKLVVSGTNPDPSVATFKRRSLLEIGEADESGAVFPGERVSEWKR